MIRLTFVVFDSEERSPTEDTHTHCVHPGLIVGAEGFEFGMLWTID